MISLSHLSFAYFLISIAFLVIIREISSFPLNVRTEGVMSLLVAAASSDQATDYSSVAPPVEWTTHSSGRRRRHSRGSRSTVGRLEQEVGDLHNRSVCRWSYHDNIDESRRPIHLPYARCTDTTLEGLHLTCHQVYYRVYVRKRTVNLGIESWVGTWESVSVGCTLADPKVHGPTTS